MKTDLRLPRHIQQYGLLVITERAFRCGSHIFDVEAETCLFLLAYSAGSRAPAPVLKGYGLIGFYRAFFFLKHGHHDYLGVGSGLGGISIDSIKIS